jgi:hypothetical protein
MMIRVLLLVLLAPLDRAGRGAADDQLSEG